MSSITIRPAALPDLPSILSILNHYILHTVYNFEYRPFTVPDKTEWFAALVDKFPVYVALAGERVVGYCYYTTYREKSAYSRSAESTIYIDHEYVNRGIGRLLYERLMERARENGMHVLMAFITSPNEGSERLHEKLGFKVVGVQKEIGWKFEKWQDVSEYQCILD